jgi:hypothetical protein
LVSVIATFILCLGASFTALADQLTLNNGDRVSGQIVKSEKGKVTVKTQFMGNEASVFTREESACLNYVSQSSLV